MMHQLEQYTAPEWAQSLLKVPPDWWYYQEPPSAPAAHYQALAIPSGASKEGQTGNFPDSNTPLAPFWLAGVCQHANQEG